MDIVHLFVSFTILSTDNAFFQRASSNSRGIEVTSRDHKSSDNGHLTGNQWRLKTWSFFKYLALR